jgi:hypothetical protein
MDHGKTRLNNAGRGWLVSLYEQIRYALSMPQAVKALAGIIDAHSIAKYNYNQIRGAYSAL